MKIYISAKLSIVAFTNDIITGSDPMGNLNNATNTTDKGAWGNLAAPERRYRDNYDF